MGTAYSDQSSSAAAYNSSPPPDDGSTVAANKVTWANSKTKLGDPVKAYADAINTALVTTLNFGSTQQTTNYTTQLSDHMTTIEIPSGSPTISLGDAATMTKNYIVTVTNTGTGSPTVALITAANTLNGTSNGTFTFPAGSATSSTSLTFKVNNGATGYYTEKVGGKNYTPITGSWVPSLGGSATYTVQSGSYVRIQGFVMISGQITVNAIGTGSSTTISGLPFTVSSGIGSTQYTAWVNVTSNSITNIVSASAILAAGGTSFQIRSRTAASAADGINGIFQNGTDVTFTAFYIAAA